VDFPPQTVELLSNSAAGRLPVFALSLSTACPVLALTDFSFFTTYPRTDIPLLDVRLLPQMTRTIVFPSAARSHGFKAELCDVLESLFHLVMPTAVPMSGFFAISALFTVAGFFAISALFAVTGFFAISALLATRRESMKRFTQAARFAFEPLRMLAVSPLPRLCMLMEHVLELSNQLVLALPQLLQTPRSLFKLAVVVFPPLLEILQLASQLSSGLLVSTLFGFVQPVFEPLHVFIHLVDLLLVPSMQLLSTQMQPLLYKSHLEFHDFTPGTTLLRMLQMLFEEFQLSPLKVVPTLRELTFLPLYIAHGLFQGPPRLLESLSFFVGQQGHGNSQNQ